MSIEIKLEYFIKVLKIFGEDDKITNKKRR